MRGKRTPIRCIETGVVYESLTEAALAYFGTSRNIWRALNGRIETAYGYHWEYV